jgi:dihydropteroate synthase
VTAPAPLIMGIVNASPESFSDGAEVGSLDDQVRRGLGLRDAGASILDLGGESGVSDRASVSEAEEIDRLVPLVERLSGEGLTVSVDTWKPGVARAAVSAGATMVNDVSGLADPEMADVCAEAGAALVITHTAAPPKEKAFPGYDDVGEEVVAFLRERIDLAAARGVERIVLDPGPDLAKTPAETVAALRALPRVVALGREVLLAVSRKDFVGALTGRGPGDRLAGTLAAVGAGVDAGASILRVHDVAAVADYLAVRAALRGEREVPPGLSLDPELRRAVWHALPRT